jgi:integrase/recombinase XerD
MMAATFPALLQRFFTDYLLRQRQASADTIAAYRDAFRLLLRFVADHGGRAPSALAMDDLTPALVGKFLDHLEGMRQNSHRTRNARLAAIHSFARYVALNEPAHALLCQRLLAMPSRRFERKLVAFLTRAEADALLASPDLSTWIGRRDRALLIVALQTGLRVSELIGLRREDVVVGPAAHVRCTGKGRKQRCTPLRRDAAVVMKGWLEERAGLPTDVIFSTRRGTRLSRDAVERLVCRHTRSAVTRCPSIKNKNVTPHVLRHTAAMDLLAHGVDRSVIALWLGHESVETTQMYLHADLRLKEQALARTMPLGIRLPRYRPTDQLLAFLERL